jgi:hypothetical protein
MAARSIIWRGGGGVRKIEPLCRRRKPRWFSAGGRENLRVQAKKITAAKKMC